MALEAGGQAPYAPPGTVIEVLRRYRERGLSVPVTTEVLERAGVPETLTQRTLQALRQLGFVGADGRPSDEFEQLSRVPDAEYRSGLQELIGAAYGDVLKFADPATDDYERVRDAFRGFNPRGQQDRMVTLFLGLCEYAGLDVSSATASRRPTSPVGISKKTLVPGRSAATARPQMRQPGATPSRRRSTGVANHDEPQTGLPPALLGLLQQVPVGGKGWTADRRDAFLSAFEAVLDFTVPLLAKSESDAESTEGEE